jgi:choice-of-anchor C domain-containing protein
VTRGQIDYVGAHWTSGHGKRSLDLHGSPGFGGVMQTFRTVAGQRYRVTFLMAANPGAQTTVHNLCVRAAGRKKDFSFDCRGKTVKDLGWEKKSWEFVAVAAQTTLEIHTIDNYDPDCGPALDDVRVVAVSE